MVLKLLSLGLGLGLEPQSLGLSLGLGLGEASLESKSESYCLLRADTTPVVYQMYKYSNDLLLFQFHPKIQRTESLWQQ